MLRHYRLPFTLLVGTLLVSTPAAGQTTGSMSFDPPAGPRRLDLSVSGGVLTSSDWGDLVLLGSIGPVGNVQQVLVRDLSVTPDFAVDGTVTYWRGRLGFRAHGAYSSSCVAVGTTCDSSSAILDDPRTGPTLNSVGVKTYLFDVGGAVGFLEQRPGRWVWPYAFAGFGGLVYDLERPIQPPLRTVTTGGVRPEFVEIEDSTEVLIALEEVARHWSVSLHVGAGIDLRIPMGPGSFGLRFEVSDHLANSPFEVDVVTLDDGRRGSAGRATRLDFSPVHNLRATAGVVVQFGL